MFTYIPSLRRDSLLKFLYASSTTSCLSPVPIACLCLSLISHIFILTTLLSLSSICFTRPFLHLYSDPTIRLTSVVSNINFRARGYLDTWWRRPNVNLWFVYLALPLVWLNYQRQICDSPRSAEFYLGFHDPFHLHQIVRAICSDRAKTQYPIMHHLVGAG